VVKLHDRLCIVGISLLSSSHSSNHTCNVLNLYIRVNCLYAILPVQVSGQFSDTLSFFVPARLRRQPGSVTLEPTMRLTVWHPQPACASQSNHTTINCTSTG